MISDEDIEEYQNDRTKLLSQESNEPTRKLHGEMGRFVYPQSDGELNREDIELCEKRQPPDVNSAGNDDSQSSSREAVKSTILSAIPKRYIILLLIALGNFNMYCVRMCLNVTIVAMTHAKGKQYNNTTSELHGHEGAEFHWDKEFQGIILGSLYWGYTALQIPAGILTVRYGGSFLLGIAIFGSSVLTLITPFIVRQNVYAFVFLRIMEGIFLGLVAASGISLISKWSPIYERSIFLMVAHSGLLWGTVFANSFSGFLAGSSWGWPSVFYYFGIQGIIWYLCWLYFAYEEPSEHPTISKTEVDLIGKHWKAKLTLREVPWRYMLTSIRVWAIIIPYSTDCWSFYTFMISFPSYLKDVQHLDITTIGLASSLPYVLAGVASPTWGYFLDVLRSKKYITTNTARKLSSFIGSGVSAIFIVAMVYASTASSAIAIVTIAVTLSNLTTSGASTNIVELAPKYSGIIMGITNCFCNVTGFVSPQFVGAVTVHGDIRRQWALVFYITAGINLLGMIFYLCFGSSEKQAWADH